MKTESPGFFENRKEAHIRHALSPDHQADGLSGLDQVRLVHEALPELDFEEISLESSCFGKPIASPFFIAGMTAGHSGALEINHTLAELCQARGWVMGVGSLRRNLEADLSGEMDQWKDFRKKFPELVLLANIGISQLIHFDLEKIQGILRLLEPQALVVHANALQEVLQPEGTPCFQGAFSALRKAIQKLEIPVILKETGCGFSKHTLQKIADLGLSAVDVSGLGGTHWGRIEGVRASRGSQQVNAARIFADWGVPTVEAVLSASQVLSNTEIWASGGVRSGLDAAKLIALGANRVGYAQPALKAALEGRLSLLHWMEQKEYELRVALFCTGCQNPTALRKRQDLCLCL